MKSVQKNDIKDLWKFYIKNRDEDSRDKLVKNYMPFVKYLVDRIVSHLPDHVKANSREDLYVEGIIGLIEAIDRFDPGKNVKFETFASKRVRGSVLDNLRKEDVLPKNVREQAKRLEKAYLEVESALGRPAKDAEIMKELGMTEQEFYGMLESIKGITLLSLNAEILNRDGESFTLEDITGEEEPVILKVEKQEIVKQLAGLIESLQEEERIVLETYYWDGLTLKEIGEVLGVSESRVCQIHSKIVIKLRNGFRKIDN